MFSKGIFYFHTNKFFKTIELSFYFSSVITLIASSICTEVVKSYSPFLAPLHWFGIHMNSLSTVFTKMTQFMWGKGLNL